MVEADTNSYSYFRKVLIFVLLAAFVVLAALFVRQVVTVLLLLFAGVLFGILLRTLRDLMHRFTGLNNGFSLVSVIVLFTLLFAGSVYFLAPKVYQQAHTFYQEIPEKWDMIRSEIAVYRWGQELANENPNFRDIFEDESNNVGEDHDMTQFVLGLISNAAALFAAFLLVFITGIYIASEPMLYSNGFLHLIPKGRRKLASQIMDEISISIQWWVVGQLCAMIFIGTVTTLGLWLIGMPYPLLFGLFAALMNFIPNIGPVIAAVPPVLIALTISVDLVIYVIVLFVIIQCIEGYFITPLIHEKVVGVPPLLIIATQFILFYLIGFLGVLLAIPLLVCIMVIVKRVYVEDILADSLEDKPSENAEGRTILDNS